VSCRAALAGAATPPPPVAPTVAGTASEAVPPEAGAGKVPPDLSWRFDNDGFRVYHNTVCAKARDLSLRKGADYASADRASEDPLQRFKNFRMCEHVGLCSTEAGIVVRMLDKVTRVGQLLSPGKIAQVKDESVEDTLLDVINYSVLLLAYRTASAQQKKEEKR
jgi:hypothetical protein